MDDDVMNKSPWQISHRFVVMLLIPVGIAFLAILILPKLADGGPAKVPRVRADERQLFLSIEGYRQEFGGYPTGENASIIRVLTGDNPKGLRLFYLRACSTNGNGQLIDPWVTPYQFIFDSTNRFTIRSAGKNKTLGDADDIVFNSVSNDFVKP